MEAENSFICPIVGPPKKLDQNILPTSTDILRYFGFLKIELSSLNRNCIMDKMLEIIVAELQKIWNSASITIVSKQRIKYLLQKLHNERRTLLKSIRLIGKDPYNIKLNDFKCRIDKLFDIAICKCKQDEKCYCKKEKKVKI